MGKAPAGGAASKAEPPGPEGPPSTTTTTIHRPMSIPTVTEAALSTIEDERSQFYEAALKLFQVPPSPRTRAKVMALHDRGIINVSLIEIIRHLLALDVRYGAEEWLADNITPPFRSSHPDPLYQYFPSSFRQLAAKTLTIKTHVHRYLEHHFDVLDTELGRLIRDLGDDRRRFDKLLQWARRRDEGELDSLCFLLNHSTRPPCPSWPVYEWISENHPSLDPAHTRATGRLQREGQRELRIGCPMANPDLLATFGICPATAEDIQEWVDTVSGVRDELDWTQEALTAIGELLSPSNGATDEENEEN